MTPKDTETLNKINTKIMTRNSKHFCELLKRLSFLGIEITHSKHSFFSMKVCLGFTIGDWTNGLQGSAYSYRH